MIQKKSATLYSMAFVFLSFHVVYKGNRFNSLTILNRKGLQEIICQLGYQGGGNEDNLIWNILKYFVKEIGTR